MGRGDAGGRRLSWSGPRGATDPDLAPSPASILAADIVQMRTTDIRAAWSYVRARTVARVLPKLKPPVPDHSEALARFLCETVRSRPTFSVLQIGAFDGVSNDPVCALLRDCVNVRAVLIEPQPAAFAALQRLWRDTPRITTLQAALSDSAGERPLYVIAEDRKPFHPFADQLASFSKGYVESECSRYMWRPAPDLVTSINVKTIDWRSLREQYGPFDLVAIDTEGYDGEILHQIDFSRQTPAIVLYEHRHLDRAMQDRCVARLEQAGYVVRQVNKADTVASHIGMPGF
jgi:FkbM family methyltransferase